MRDLSTKAWVSDLAKANQKPSLLVLEMCHYEISDERESVWIDFYRTPFLLNRRRYMRLPPRRRVKAALVVNPLLVLTGDRHASPFVSAWPGGGETAVAIGIPRGLTHRMSRQAAREFALNLNAACDAIEAHEASLRNLALSTEPTP